MVNIVINVLLIVILVYLFSQYKSKYNEKKDIDCEKLFDNFPEPMIIINKENKITKTNEAFLNFFRLKSNDILGKNVKEILVIEESQTKKDYIKGKIEDGIPYKGTIKLKNNREVLKVNIRSIPIYDDNKLIGRHMFFGKVENGDNYLSTVLRNSRRKIKDLHKTALKMEKVRKEQEIYELTVRAAENILDFDLCTLDIVEDNKLVVKATSSNIISGESISAFIDSENLATYVYKNKTALITRDIQSEKYANPTNDKYHSALTIPIGDRGIFQAVSTKIDEFNQEDLELLELLIAHALSAIQRLELDKKIRYLGFHDNLTGLYNRHFINEEIERLDTKRQLPLSIIIGDLNGLKLVNDIFGHEEGDQYLKKASKILKRCIREEDILGRWGGDEFILILPKTTEIKADLVIDRINKEMSKTNFDERPISISLGKSTKNINENKDIKIVIEEADYRMYKNKSYIHREKDIPLINMIKKKFNNDELDKSEIYRLDSLLDIFEKDSIL